MQDKGLFEGSFIEEPSIIARLLKECAEGFREFAADPVGFMKSAITGDGLGGRRRKERLMFGIAIAVLVFSTLSLAVLFPWYKFFGDAPVQADSQELTVITMVNPDDLKSQPIDAPKADGKKAGGGGGGGRKTPTPPSQGQLPKHSLAQPMIAPTPEPPKPNPLLPVPETIQIDPRLEPTRQIDVPTGLPTGVPGPPSAGPGEGNGIGTGKGGGIGSGDGRGGGPGSGYNTGGGVPGLGGGSNPNTPATSVDTKPILLNRPRPLYTEEARKNKITGIVRVRVLVGPDGTVKRVSIVGGGLPDGLNEQAISAAYQMRFRPATKSGQSVAYYQTVDIEFNLR